MKNTFCSVALGAAALAALTLSSAPVSARTMHSSKKHAKHHAKYYAKKHTSSHAMMHSQMHANMHTNMPAGSKVTTASPGNAGPTRTGTGPSPTTGRVLGRVPSAVGDAGQVNAPSPPAGGGVSR